MNTTTSMQARISAFADGELAEADIDQVMKDLATPEGRAIWETYHRVGDALRTQEDVPLSAGFAAAFAQRLEAEPAVLAPAAMPPEKRQAGISKRVASSAMAVAAVAAVAFFVTPQVLKGMQQDVAPAAAPAVAVASSPEVSHASMMPATATTAMLRPADVDEYVMAHQRLSPAFTGSAHVAVEAAASGASK